MKQKYISLFAAFALLASLFGCGRTVEQQGVDYADEANWAYF